MIDPVVYRGRADGDRFTPDSPGAFKFAFKPFNGKEVELLIREYKKTRSNKQNKAWWGIVIKMFMQYMGERDKNYVHRVVLEEIGHYEIKIAFGQEKKEILSTHNLKTDKFNHIYQAAQELGAQYGVIIPDPESTQAAAVLAAY